MFSQPVGGIRIHMHFMLSVHYTALRGGSSLLSADISVLARRYLRPCPQISLPVALRVQRTLWHSGRSRLAGMLYF